MTPPKKIVPDAPDVPGPSGPTLEDVCDVIARTNRGILELEKLIQNLTVAFFTFVMFWFALVLVKARA